MTTAETGIRTNRNFTARGSFDGKLRPHTQGFKVSGAHTARSPGMVSPTIEDLDGKSSKKGILKNPTKLPSHVRFD